AQHHRAYPQESEVERLFACFLSRQSGVLERYSDVIPGVPEAVRRMRDRGLRIGSTTGYTRTMLDAVARVAAEQGYSPDASVTPDEVGEGRPHPWMCYQNAMLLKVYPLDRLVKIGDTPSDMMEGRNAGMWTIGITTTGNQVGLTLAEARGLPALELR